MVAVRVSARVNALISLFMGGEVIFVVDSNTGLREDSFDEIYVREGSSGEKWEGLFLYLGFELVVQKEQRLLGGKDKLGL